MKLRNDMGELIELANNVLSKYDIVPEDVTVIQNEGLKTVWKFRYNNKNMCLKRLRHTLDKATFSVNAQMHIFYKGGNVPEVHQNSIRQPITQVNGQLFVLYDWINGRDLNFKRTQDVISGIEALATFHAFSKGYVPPEGASISTRLGNWDRQYRSMRDDMIHWKEVAQANISNHSYNTYLQHVDGIIELCNQAIQALQNSAYKTLAGIQLHESILCHQDYGSGNAIHSDNGIYVIDLDGVTYDLPIRDLRKLIGKRAEKRGTWVIDEIDAILGYYEKNNEFSTEEREVLKIDMMFPYWFYGTVKNIFLKNKMESPSKIAKSARLEQDKMLVLDSWN